jgi:hypothetical protein
MVLDQLQSYDHGISHPSWDPAVAHVTVNDGIVQWAALLGPPPPLLLLLLA